MVRNIGLHPFAQRHAKVPLAKMSSAITFLRKDLGNGHFPFQQVCIMSGIL